VQLEKELAGFHEDRDSLITIGVFDGVHLGHKYLISQVIELARQQGLRSVVITFNKHPQEILAPESHPPFLTDSREKANLLKKEGVDSVIILSFTKKLAQMSAPEFLNILKTKLSMRGLVIGPDFALGRNNEGNISILCKLSKEMGFSLKVIPPAVKNGEVVSSTGIRKALAEGNMEKVQVLLGRHFSLHGKVIHGKGRGVGLGFPTANLDILPCQAVPSDGVYATLAHIGSRIYNSVTNVGMNPTFANTIRTIESFLFGLDGDLYGHEVRIEFVHKLRGEIKFKNTADLTAQVSKDIQQAKEILINEAIAEHGYRNCKNPV
jgi:riboflavin kinase/FMN adenylyltransferase